MDKIYVVRIVETEECFMDFSSLSEEEAHTKARGWLHSHENYRIETIEVERMEKMRLQNLKNLLAKIFDLRDSMEESPERKVLKALLSDEPDVFTFTSTLPRLLLRGR